MSDNENKEEQEEQKHELRVGRLLGKTTTHEVTMQIQDPSVEKNTYLVSMVKKMKMGHVLISFLVLQICGVIHQECLQL